MSLLAAVTTAMASWMLSVQGAPAAAGAGASAEPVAGPSALPEWPRDDVFYLLFVRSFADSSEGPLAGDGVGDLRGLIERLDYLNDGDPETTTDLGVTGLWMMPIAQSPSYHGYDTVDYRAIDDEYGTMEDFRELVRECQARGIKVVVDLVLNHTADEHPWFVESTDPESDRHDWYVWSREKPAWLGPWGQPVWHDHKKFQSGKYYYGCFWDGMPDLNVANAEVKEELFDIAEFWLGLGVDGFRLDAVRHLIEEGEVQSSSPATLAWLAAFREHCHAVDSGAWVLGEVWTDRTDIGKYLGGEAPALDSAFDFPLAGAIVEGVIAGDAGRIDAELRASWEAHGGVMATFLTNHDMDRVMSRFGGDVGQAKAAAAVLLTAPGTPFIYYGEEIGMTGAGPHEDIRRPMQWTPDRRTAGFSEAQPWQPVQANTNVVHLQGQRQSPRSLWSHYRDLIRVRTGSAALRRGSYTPVETGDGRVLGFVREHEGERVLVLVNVSGEAVRDGGLDAAGLGLAPGARPAELLHGLAGRPVQAERAWWPILPMAPHTAYVLQLE
jgi:glycosidase